MRVEGGVAQVFREVIGELGAAYMLQLLGHLVYFIPAEAEPLHQEGLPQAVLADQLQGGGLALGGELHAVVGFVLQQAFLRELLQHHGNAAGLDVELFGEVLGTGRGAILQEGMYGLDVVLFAAGEHGCKSRSK